MRSGTHKMRAAAAKLDERAAHRIARRYARHPRQVGDMDDASPRAAAAATPVHRSADASCSRRYSRNRVGYATRRDGVETLAVVGHRTSRTRHRTGACAFSSIASNTGARSPGEELMTCKTSAVAVCCSSASRVSVISRAFSIAMTA